MAHLNERDRLSTLESYHILDTAPDALLDMVARVAAQSFGAPCASINLIDGRRQWSKARYGDVPRELSLDESICRHTMLEEDMLVLAGAELDTRCADNPRVRKDGLRFYAGVPLVAPNGHCIGALCVADRIERHPTSGQLDTLRNLGGVAMGLIEAHRAAVNFRREKDYLLKLADNSPGGLFEFAMDEAGNQRLHFVSAGIRETIGVSPEEALDDIANVFSRVHPDDAEAFFASIDTAFATRSSWKHEFRVKHPVRGEVHVVGMSAPMATHDGVTTWQGCLMDVTDRAAEGARLLQTRRELDRRYSDLAEYQKLFSQIGRMAKVGACAFDLESREMSWTTEVYAMHGVPLDFIPTLPAMLGFCEEKRRRDVGRRFRRTVKAGEPLEIEYPIIAGDGARRWLKAILEPEVDSGERPRRLVGSLQDITGERLLLEKISHHATHDHVTGLANRPAFLSQLSELLHEPGKTSFNAVVFLDLDHFKDINDAFGYEAGDRLITVIGSRIEAIVARYGARSAASRFGGDEFAFVLADLEAIEGLPSRLRAIADELSAPTAINGHTIQAAVSMGVSVSPKDGRSAADLLRKADLALRHSKQSGRARTSFFTRAMEAQLSAEQFLKSEMTEGLERGEFEVFYQPIMDIKLGRLDGFEALLRWHHPGRGLLSAGVFAHLLDDVNIGPALSAAVIGQVTDTILAWQKRRLPFGQVAINITSSQLRNPLFEEQLAGVIEAGVPPAHLKLEITEGVLLGRTADKAFQVLARLREKGFAISLDDFGTGYASLVHLAEFPIDQLKIDMSFVRQITTSERARTIVHTMCALANGLNLTAVAEGIEDEHVEQMLRLMGCHFGQGYRYAKALPRAEAEAFILSSAAVADGGGYRPLGKPVEPPRRAIA